MSKRYLVTEGDCLHSIAFLHGWLPDSLWLHSDNSLLRRKRSDPHLLLPGDHLVIPEIRRKTEDCATESLHVFRRRGVPKTIRVQILDNEIAVPGLKCQIDVDGRISKATTDDNGWIEFPISPAAKRTRIVFDSGLAIELALGHLDPIEEVTGIQQRLYNLGYYDGEIDGSSDKLTKAALLEFQRDQLLDESGSADAATKNKLITLNEGES